MGPGRIAAVSLVASGCPGTAPSTEQHAGPFRANGSPGSASRRLACRPRKSSGRSRGLSQPGCPGRCLGSRGTRTSGRSASDSGRPGEMGHSESTTAVLQATARPTANPGDRRVGRSTAHPLRKPGRGRQTGCSGLSCQPGPRPGGPGPTADSRDLVVVLATWPYSSTCKSVGSVRGRGAVAPMNWTIGPPPVLDAIRRTRGGTASWGFSRFDPGPDLDGSGPMLYQTVG